VVACSNPEEVHLVILRISFILQRSKLWILRPSKQRWTCSVFPIKELVFRKKVVRTLNIIAGSLITRLHALNVLNSYLHENTRCSAVVAPFCRTKTKQSAIYIEKTPIINPLAYYDDYKRSPIWDSCFAAVTVCRLKVEIIYLSEVRDKYETIVLKYFNKFYIGNV
jgi:hypothetical protein